MLKEVSPKKPLSLGKNRNGYDGNTFKWKDIDWTKIETYILRLQMRIYNLSQNGEREKMWSCQRTLTRSFLAKLLSVRRVTQDNRGKSTPGVDGKTVLNPDERLLLASELSLDGKANSIRRVFIPKPDSKEKRPLGIPTIKDRAKQYLAKLALEPEWEAKFEPNSDGFRPARSCHDAIAAIYTSMNQKPKFVLDADIRKCFEKIDHEALLKKVDTYSKMKRQIAAWLKAGILENGILRESVRGTPQGGVISPLLANIALDGLERSLENWMKDIELKDSKGRVLSHRRKCSALTVVRYADDIAILHPLVEIIILVKEQVEKWLDKMGLSLKGEMTRICHTLEPYKEVPPGFDFLGCRIQQHPMGKFHRGKKGQAYKTLIRPSGKSVSRHLRATKEVLKHVRSTPRVIEEINPKIVGWCQYFKHVASKKHFAKCDYTLSRQFYLWARKKHPTREYKWCLRKYFKRVKNRKLFGFFQRGVFVPQQVHSDTVIKRHIKIKGGRSPFDGDWKYWSRRCVNGRSRSQRMTMLFNRQNGAWCGLRFRDEDIIEIDHRIPSSQGGRQTASNLQLLHGHCHDQKSARDPRPSKENLN